MVSQRVRDEEGTVRAAPLVDVDRVVPVETRAGVVLGRVDDRIPDLEDRAPTTDDQGLEGRPRHAVADPHVGRVQRVRSLVVVVEGGPATTRGRDPVAYLSRHRGPAGGPLRVDALAPALRGHRLTGWPAVAPLAARAVALLAESWSIGHGVSFFSVSQSIVAAMIVTTTNTITPAMSTTRPNWSMRTTAIRANTVRMPRTSARGDEADLEMLHRYVLTSLYSSSRRRRILSRLTASQLEPAVEPWWWNGQRVTRLRSIEVPSCPSSSRPCSWCGSSSGTAARGPGPASERSGYPRCRDTDLRVRRSMGRYTDSGLGRGPWP